MRALISGFIFWCCSPIIQADTPALDTAVETGGIRVEFNTASNLGRVHVLRCEQCSKTNYLFNDKPEIIKHGNVISFERFMTDFWNAKYPTLILDIKTLTVLKIVY